MKKFLTVMLALAMCCGVFTGCDKEDKLVVATNAAFAPFEYVEGDKYVGIDMDIAAGFAEYLGLELEVRDMEFDAVVTSVGKHGVDIAMAGLPISEKRKESVDFTEPYYDASQMLIVKSDVTDFDNCTTADEIVNIINTEGVTIGVQGGTTGEMFVKGSEDFGFAGLLNVECKSHSNAGLAVTDMINGNVDYVIVDEMPAKNIAKKMSGVKVIDIKLTDEQYAFGVDKAQPELLEKLNAYLAEIKENGTFDEIINKYFQD